jgi:hypothetical protein
MVKTRYILAQTRAEINYYVNHQSRQILGDLGIKMHINVFSTCISVITTTSFPGPYIASSRLGIRFCCSLIGS